MVTTGWSGLVEKFLTEEEKQIIADEYNRIAATPNTSIADRNKVLTDAYFYALNKMNQIGKPLIGITQGSSPTPAVEDLVYKWKF